MHNGTDLYTVAPPFKSHDREVGWCGRDQGRLDNLTVPVHLSAYRSYSAALFFKETHVWVGVGMYLDIVHRIIHIQLSHWRNVAFLAEIQKLDSIP